MKNNVYSQFQYAKQKRDLKVMETLYFQNPNDEHIKFEYAKLLIEKGYCDDGKEYLKELLNTKNADYAALELGRAYVHDQEYSAARKILNRIARKDDQYGLFELGILEFKLQNYEEAKKIYEKLVRLYDDKRAKVELAKIESIIGNKDTACETLKEYSYEEGGQIARYSLAMIERKKGNYEEAKKIFMTLFNESNSDKAKFEIAKINAEIGDINGARFYLQELFGTTKDEFARFELSRLESRVGNYDRARQLLNELYENTNNEYVILERGIVEFLAGNTSKAREYFNSLINTDSEKMAYHLLAVLEIKQENYIEAFKIIKIIVEKELGFNAHQLLFISKKLNIFFDAVDYEKILMTYNNRQILNYDENLAIEHIISNHNRNNEKSCFNTNIDVRNIFSYIKDNLDDQYRIPTLHFNDTYVIPFQNIGLKNQEYLKVVTNPNTKNIITMYPVFNKYEVSNDDDEIEEFKKFAKKRIPR